MDLLEELFALRWEEPDPQTPEYLESKKAWNGLADKIEALVGQELMDKYIGANWDYMEIKCQSFFLYGLRLGLELLRLSI